MPLRSRSLAGAYSTVKYTGFDIMGTSDPCTGNPGMSELWDITNAGTFAYQLQLYGSFEGRQDDQCRLPGPRQQERWLSHRVWRRRLVEAFHRILYELEALAQESNGIRVYLRKRRSCRSRKDIEIRVERSLTGITSAGKLTNDVEIICDETIDIFSEKVFTGDVIIDKTSLEITQLGPLSRDYDVMGAGTKFCSSW
ncbi:hypothetical protein F5146DRAFT_1132347 [Armillaria mellea]|nr:hypothetical protein F5146DRAFT_1132347 [Armillaria mellea]